MIPVAVAYPPAVGRARRTTFGPVVLRPSAYVVERLRIVDRHAVDCVTGRFVKMRNVCTSSYVLSSPPSLPTRMCFLSEGSNAHRVVIDVHPGVFPTRWCSSSSRRHSPFEVGIDRVDRVRPMRVDEQLVAAPRRRRDTTAPTDPAGPRCLQTLRMEPSLAQSTTRGRYGSMTLPHRRNDRSPPRRQRSPGAPAAARRRRPCRAVPSHLSAQKPPTDAADRPPARRVRRRLSAVLASASSRSRPHRST